MTGDPVSLILAAVLGVIHLQRVRDRTFIGGLQDEEGAR